jgi:hypothetical protein
VVTWNLSPGCNTLGSASLLPEFITYHGTIPTPTISEHVPVSVSIFSNVPEYDNKPVFICDSENKKLIKNFVKTILKISLKAKSITENKSSYY